MASGKLGQFHPKILDALVSSKKGNEIMRLHELSREVMSSTEHLGLRVDKKTMQEIRLYREVFGKKTVAIWLRNAIREALNAERDKLPPLAPSK